MKDHSFSSSYLLVHIYFQVPTCHIIAHMAKNSFLHIFYNIPLTNLPIHLKFRTVFPKCSLMFQKQAAKHMTSALHQHAMQVSE